MKDLGHLLDSDEFRDFIARAENELLPAMLDSGVVVTIAPPRDAVDLKIAVEIGLCILLDKPLVMIVDEGREVPRRLLRAADHIVRGDLSTPAGRDRAYMELGAALVAIGKGGGHAGSKFS